MSELNLVGICASAQHPEVELYLVPAPSKPGLVGFVRHKWAKRAKEVPGIIRSSQNRKEKRNITFRYSLTCVLVLAICTLVVQCVHGQGRRIRLGKYVA